jgi:uncharacterized protein YabN with tetrapyrrole methylase and pyrophosphatase domain
LTVVGTGIKLVAQTTHEARQAIERADKVLYVVADCAVAHWIRQLNPAAESLLHLYEPDKHRRETYEEMVEHILDCVRLGQDVCAVFYGHPGVFVYPSHKAVRLAREEGYKACMSAGISAEDCLFADLGVDPARHGHQSYEATNFLMRKRRFDPHAGLILWQIGVIGDHSVRQAGTFNEEGIAALIEVLQEEYGSAHEVVVYEAAQWTITEPSIQSVPLARLGEARITPISTLYVPPKPGAPVDRELSTRLGWSGGNENPQRTDDSE